MSIWQTMKRLFTDDTSGGTRWTPNKQENNMTAFIRPTSDGGAILVDTTGSVVGKYARARDAKRGAARRGFNVA